VGFGHHGALTGAACDEQAGTDDRAEHAHRSTATRPCGTRV